MKRLLTILLAIAVTGVLFMANAGDDCHHPECRHGHAVEGECCCGGEAEGCTGDCADCEASRCDDVHPDCPGHDCESCEDCDCGGCEEDLDEAAGHCGGCH